MTCILFLGNIRRSATEPELLSFLKSLGLYPKQVKIPQPAKGFAFAYFETEKEVKDAIAALAGKYFQGMLVNPDWARERGRSAPVKHDAYKDIETRRGTVQLQPDLRSVPFEPGAETRARDEALKELNARERRAQR